MLLLNKGSNKLGKSNRSPEEFEKRREVIIDLNFIRSLIVVRKLTCHVHDLIIIFEIAMFDDNMINQRNILNKHNYQMKIIETVHLQRGFISFYARLIDLFGGGFIVFLERQVVI